jgi:hypothetical protein
VGSGLDPGSDLDLHMSCGKETLARPNRFESPLLLGEDDSILRPLIVVNNHNNDTDDHNEDVLMK